jgi:NAD-specific glutamate dehydrogenase
VATTRMIADAGAAFFPMMIETTGCSVAEIAAAYLKAQALTRVNEVRGPLEQIRVGDAQHAMYRAWVRLDEGTAEVAGRWLSAAGKIPSDADLVTMTEAFDQVWKLQPADTAAKLRGELHALTVAGCEEAVATTVLKAGFAGVALTVYSEAKRLNVPLAEMIVRHLAVSRASRLQEILDNLAKRPATGRWDPIALQILHHRFFDQLRKLVVRVPLPGSAKSVDALAPMLAQGPLAEVRSQVEDLLGGEAQPSIPTLIVLEERVASCISRLPATEARA